MKTIFKRVQSVKAVFTVQTVHAITKNISKFLLTIPHFNGLLP